jgi:hypothetical protein
MYRKTKTGKTVKVHTVKSFGQGLPSHGVMIEVVEESSYGDPSVARRFTVGQAFEVRGNMELVRLLFGDH